MKHEAKLEPCLTMSNETSEEMIARAQRIVDEAVVRTMQKATGHLNNTSVRD